MSESTTAPPAASASDASGKVAVFFKPAGGASQLKVSVVKVARSERCETVIKWLRKGLQLKPNDALFVYVNQSFQPSGDEIISNLEQCFTINGKLTLHYSPTPAWG